MPQLSLDKKLSFEVDQVTIDRVEALALIEEVSLDAWLRRIVDDKILMGSRHMGSDHIDLLYDSELEVRPAVMAIIEGMAHSLICPLRDKAEIALHKLQVR